jgi:hypothetical protein
MMPLQFNNCKAATAVVMEEIVGILLDLVQVRNLMIFDKGKHDDWSWHKQFQRNIKRDMNRVDCISIDKQLVMA